jgi:hypothetical protein
VLLKGGSPENNNAKALSQNLRWDQIISLSIFSERKREREREREREKERERKQGHPELLSCQHLEDSCKALWEAQLPASSQYDNLLEA